MGSVSRVDLTWLRSGANCNRASAPISSGAAAAARSHNRPLGFDLIRSDPIRSEPSRCNLAAPDRHRARRSRRSRRCELPVYVTGLKLNSSALARPHATHALADLKDPIGSDPSEIDSTEGRARTGNGNAPAAYRPLCARRAGIRLCIGIILSLSKSPPHPIAARRQQLLLYTSRGAAAKHRHRISSRRRRELLAS